MQVYIRVVNFTVAKVVLTQLLSLALLASSSYAQSPYAQSPQRLTAVTIKVTDPSGAVIPNTQVRIVPYATTTKLFTGPEGNLTVQLEPGRYELYAKAPAFKAYKGQFEVRNDQNQVVPVLLIIQTGSYPWVIPESSAKEEALLKLEDSYWKSVESLDQKSCKSFWHPDAIAWYNNLLLDGREGAANWCNAAKGLRLEDFIPSSIGAHIVGDTGVTFYNVTSLWVDQYGRGEPVSFHVSHTWIRVGKEWRIIAESATRSQVNLGYQ